MNYLTPWYIMYQYKELSSKDIALIVLFTYVLNPLVLAMAHQSYLNVNAKS